MKLAVITSGFLPVPATKGGAVENLIVNLLNENENNKKIRFNIFSIYDEKAIETAKKYNETDFIFIKPNFMVRTLDNIIFFLAKKILKKENSQSYRYIIQRLYYLNKCSKYIKKNDFDKVLLENHPTQYLALKWRNNYKKYKGRYYYHCHNEFPGTYGCEEIIKNTKNIICVSEFRRKSIEKYLKYPAKQSSNLKNCIDSSVISKKASNEELKEIREKYNIKDTETIMIFTGRIVPGKGIPEIIKALKNVKNKNYKFLFLGSSLNSLNVKNLFEEEIISLIDDSIKEHIIFTGFINYNELYKYYSLADFAVMPSIMDDSAPLSVIEALSCGLPLITTNSGGIPEYATHNSSIILDRYNNIIDNLTLNIEFLLSDSRKLNEMSKNARIISKNFTLECFYNEFLNLIEEGK